jgi:hypothetical protein
MKKQHTLLGLIIILTLFFSACAGADTTATQITGSSGVTNLAGGNATPATNSPVQPVATEAPTQAATSEPTSTATSVPTQQPSSVPQEVGPQLADFPPGINPLTGLPVSDPAMLNLPAIMISIPNFPVTARPQAGLSFAPWTFEIYIGNGESRFLTTFYGEQPQVTAKPKGSCKVRSDPFAPGAVVLGKRAWLDVNQNGIQDPNEPGIAGICVTLNDATGKPLQTTSTDSNGFYGFNVDAGQTYVLGFEKPDGLAFTNANVGLENLDSDVNPLSGMTGNLTPSASELDWDAGYVQGTGASGPGAAGDSGSSASPSGTSDNPAALPPADVGPVRSMRLPYGKIAKFFQGGCLVSASGDPAVLAQVPGCKYVFGDDASVNDAVLKITDLQSLAENNKTSYPINYSGNLFDPTAPAGGAPASQVNALWNWQNQSLFRYDPLSRAYQRNANTPDAPLTFTPQTDRLNGEQLLYDNIIVMYVDYIAQAETLMNIALEIGNMGRSDLFRNGQLYHIYWNTVAQSYEQQTQRARPIRFTDAKGNPVALAPGHTWVLVFTTASVTYEKNPGSGLWTAEFHAPVVP